MYQLFLSFRDTNCAFSTTISWSWTTPSWFTVQALRRPSHLAHTLTRPKLQRKMISSKKSLCLSWNNFMEPEKDAKNNPIFSCLNISYGCEYDLNKRYPSCLKSTPCSFKCKLEFRPEVPHNFRKSSLLVQLSVLNQKKKKSRYRISLLGWGNYSREETIWGNTVDTLTKLNSTRLQLGPFEFLEANDCTPLRPFEIPSGLLLFYFLLNNLNWKSSLGMFFNSFQLQLRRCKRETISPKTSLSPTDVAASYVACPVRWL